MGQNDSTEEEEEYVPEIFTTTKKSPVRLPKYFKAHISKGLKDY
jgi:hypothetical protein